MIDIDDYIPAREAAVKMDLAYGALMMRVRRGKCRHVKRGWAIFIHKDEVTEEARRKTERALANQNLEKSAR